MFHNNTSLEYTQFMYPYWKLIDSKLFIYYSILILYNNRIYFIQQY